MYDSLLLTFRMPYVVPAASLMGVYVGLAGLIVMATAGIAAILTLRVSSRVDAYEAIRKGAR
jgi:ABC-type antimicrobial peptide transport system permease subunit